MEEWEGVTVAEEEVQQREREIDRRKPCSLQCFHFMGARKIGHP